MTTYQLTVNVHVLAGAIALLSFWMAALTRKGSVRHRYGGRVYLLAMLAVVVTALPLAVAAFLQDKPVTGTFLAYLIVITATPAWTAYRAIRDKNSIARFAGPVFRFLAWGNIASGLVVLALGIHYRATLLAGMALIGLISGPFMLRFARRETHEVRWWLTQHFGGMIGAGVATHIAFFGLGLGRLLPSAISGATQQLAFFVPVLVAVAARIYLSRKYAVHPTKISAPVAA